MCKGEGRKAYGQGDGGGGGRYKQKKNYFLDKSLCHKHC